MLSDPDAVVPCAQCSMPISATIALMAGLYTIKEPGKSIWESVTWLFCSKNCQEKHRENEE